MLASDLITHDIPPLKHTDTVDRALNWMEEFKVFHLPVVKDRSLIGLLAESDILDANNKRDLVLEKSQIHLLKPVIRGSQHAYDALKLMSALNLSLLPVLDENDNYLGSISQKSVLEKMSWLSAAAEPGGIIELEMNKNDYSLTQIASIIEGNDAKIISCYINSLPDSTKIEVTIKINKEDLSRILQTFYRYNYHVKAYYHQQQFTDDLKHRFNEFMRFINI